MNRKNKQEQIELATLKRKKRREKKNLFRKIKKRINSKNEVIFDKNIPLIEQVKNEIGKEEFNELFNQNEMKNNDDNDTYLMKPNISAMNKNNNLTSENGEEISNNNEINQFMADLENADVDGMEKLITMKALLGIQELLIQL